MDIEALIGLSKEKVVDLIKHYCLATGRQFRIDREDQNYYVVTRDLVPDRINLSFDSGKLSKVKYG